MYLAMKYTSKDSWKLAEWLLPQSCLRMAIQGDTANMPECTMHETSASKQYGELRPHEATNETTANTVKPAKRSK